MPKVIVPALKLKYIQMPKVSNTISQMPKQNRNIFTSKKGREVE